MAARLTQPIPGKSQPWWSTTRLKSQPGVDLKLTITAYRCGQVPTLPHSRNPPRARILLPMPARSAEGSLQSRSLPLRASEYPLLAFFVFQVTFLPHPDQQLFFADQSPSALHPTPFSQHTTRSSSRRHCSLAGPTTRCSHACRPCRRKVSTNTAAPSACIHHAPTSLTPVDGKDVTMTTRSSVE